MMGAFGAGVAGNMVNGEGGAELVPSVTHDVLRTLCLHSESVLIQEITIAL